MDAAPVDLDGDDQLGVVCVHGFTGSPYEMRYLGARLAAAGAIVRTPLLPGHGSSVADLAATRWQDWAWAVEREVEALRARCARIAVIGQSLGGLLALEYAARRPVAAVASLAAPLWLGGASGVAARWLAGPLGRWIPRVPKLGGSDVRDRRVRAENPGYRAFPTRALGQLLEMMRITEAALPRITAPLLVLHARRDHTAPFACAARIAALATRASDRRIVELHHSFHLIAIDVERDAVANEVIGFLRRHAFTPSDRPAAARADASADV